MGRHLKLQFRSGNTAPAVYHPENPALMSKHPFLSLLDDPQNWQVFASGHAEGRISAIKDPAGSPGLRLEYDFHGGGGFVVIRRVIAIEMPEAFEIGFLLRGEGPPNHFEFKVADPGGTNVWRHLAADFPMPTGWTGHRFNERDLLFAWGPAGGGAPKEIGAIEFVIAAGPGGKGRLDLAAPEFVDQTLRKPRKIHASSEQADCPPEAVFRGDRSKPWRAASGDAKPWWQVDFGRSHRFGGLVIHWPEALPARGFVVETSTDGETWTTLHRANAASGNLTHISTAGAEASFLRIQFTDSACAALLAVELKPDAFSRTPNEFLHHVAGDFPRGCFPRYWLREQSYWTPVGSPEGRRRALINEEGMVEVDEAGFSLEPFVWMNGRLLTWSDVETTCLLPDDGMPMPEVKWKSPDMSLRVRPWVDGIGDAMTLHVTYILRFAKPPVDARLIVGVRPFQVNPPWQAFRNLGGRSPIHGIQCNHDGMTVEERRVSVSPRPDRMAASAFEESATLMDDGKRSKTSANDPSGLASAQMAWFSNKGQKVIEATISIPYGSEISPPGEHSRANALKRWRRKLGGVQWKVPACAEPALDCFRTAAGHILINRDGPAIQPGPRRYTRSWVRDCVIMGAALAKAGVPEALSDFLTWYSQFQREDGFVPCVVDRDGVDWLVEHDSHGQFIWGIREVMRHGGKKDFLKNLYPFASKAADYLIQLRSQRMTDAYRSDEKAACFGLLPESASHEGYLAHPVHSYWDDFWGIRGLEAAADLAETMNEMHLAGRWKSETTAFQQDTIRSIEKVISDRQLNYIPGSVEWADFDPTATSNAIAQLDFAESLPAGPLHAMLDTYLDGFRRKHSGGMEWNNYTAYEIRIIGAMVRLGKRKEANELLDFFLSDRRPLAWNQWPEITWRDPRSPGHLGDVPHTWIAAEYLLAFASMVAAEREADDSLVLASGMPWEWIAGEGGFSVRGLPMRHGVLDFSIAVQDSKTIQVAIGGNLAEPEGGITIIPPLPDGFRISAVTCQQSGGPCSTDGTSVKTSGFPFHGEIKITPIRPATPQTTA